MWCCRHSFSHLATFHKSSNIKMLQSRQISACAYRNYTTQHLRMKHEVARVNRNTLPRAFSALSTRHVMPSDNKQLCTINSTSSRSFATQDWIINTFYFSNPVLFTEAALLRVYDFMGFPWWLTVFMTTSTFRCLITFPLGVYSQKILTKLELLHPEKQKAMTILESYITSSIRIGELNEAEAKKIYIKRGHEIGKELIAKHSCSPYKTTITALIQVPIWVCLSLSIRKLTGCVPDVPAHPGMLTEGLAWFPDLTIPDHYCFLSLILLASHLATVEIHGLLQDPNVQITRWQKILKYLFRFLALWIALISIIMPTGVSSYWALSAAFGLAQNILLRLPRVRRLCGIPKTPSEISKPISTAYRNLKKAFKIK